MRKRERDDTVVKTLVSLVTKAVPKKEEVKEKEEEEEWDEAEDEFNDAMFKEKFLKVYSEADWELQSNTDASEWTKDMRDRYIQLRDAKEVKAAPAGKYTGDDLIPVYNPDKSYRPEEARAIINLWKDENNALKKDWPNARKSELFGPLPASKNAQSYTAWLKRANAEIIRVKLDLANAAASDEEDDDSAPATPVKARKPTAPVTVIKKQKGKGVQGKVPYEWTPFGRYLISPERLRDEDIVTLVRPLTHQKVNKFPNKVVSAGVKVVLTEFLAGRQSPMELLTPDEKEWVNWFFHETGAKLAKKPVSKLEVKRTPKEMKERIAVLYGEIAEGPNDNPQVKKELKTLFGQALLRGILTDQQIINLREFIQTF